MSKQTTPPAQKPATQHLKTGQVIDLAIATLDEEGCGLAVHDITRVLVSGALPGELVRAKVTHVGRREAFAEAIKILRRAPSRLVTPPCGRAPACDGCPLISMNYPAQLAWKSELVTGELRHYPSLAGALLHPVLPSARPLHYRNSAKLVVSGKFAAPLIGIYRRNSHEVIDISDCPLHHPLINRLVEAVKEGIRKGKVSIFSPRSGHGLLRYLVVRVSEATSQVMVVLVTTERSYNEIHHLAKHVQGAVPEVTVVVQNVNSSSGNVILGQQDHFVTKSKALEDRIGEIRFAISPRSFFQVNNSGARAIYEKVREWAALTGKETVVDLYCGIGGISLFLAEKVREVIGFEVVAAAVADAKQNAQLNGIRNCRFDAGDAVKLLEELREEGKRVDLIVLNPPRKGCDERLLQDVAAIAPGRLIYVSCSPRTLARDLDILARLGYATREVQPVDMFPQTPHVENVALLVKDK